MLVSMLCLHPLLPGLVLLQPIYWKKKAKGGRKKEGRKGALPPCSISAYDGKLSGQSMLADQI
jgi:hypothetical protein